MDDGCTFKAALADAKYFMRNTVIHHSVLCDGLASCQPCAFQLAMTMRLTPPLLSNSEILSSFVQSLSWKLVTLFQHWTM